MEQKETASGEREKNMRGKNERERKKAHRERMGEKEKRTKCNIRIQSKPETKRTTQNSDGS